MRKLTTSVVRTLPFFAGLFLLHCSSAPEGGSGSNSSASSSGLCAAFCDQLVSCDTSQDKDTCDATCNDELGRTMTRVRDDVKSSIDACVNALDCKTILSGGGVADCVKQAAASVAPSSTDKVACADLAKAETSCGLDAISIATCLDDTKIYSDETLNQVIACTKKSCDVMPDCVKAALGASSDSTDGGVDSGHDSGRDAGRDSGDAGRDSGHASSGSSGSSGSGTCPGSAPTQMDLDSSGGWNAPPARTPGACSAADIQRFQSNFNGASSYTSLGAGLSASCNACIFSHEADATWKSIVTDASGSNGFINYGACYAVKSGSNACGKAVQYQELCVSISCSACADSAVSSCAKSASVLDTCNANFGSNISASCPSDQATAAALDTTCGNIINAVTFLCGS